MSEEQDTDTKQVTDSGSGGTEEVPDPELDNLLNDALQDFVRPQPAKATQPPTAIPSAPITTDLASMVAAAGINAATVGREGQGSGGGGGGEALTEDFIQQATKQFEQTMRMLMQKQQQKEHQELQKESENESLASVAASSQTQTQSQPASEATQQPSANVPQLDLNTMAAQFAQFAEAATKSAEQSQSDADFTKCLADTLNQLSENNEQLQNPPNADDLTKLFESMGLGGGDAAGGAGGLGALFPLMQMMLENVLSKEVLYSPMKEITDKYPDWLADNRASLPEEDFTRYNKQYDIMKQVVDAYDAESEGDSEEVKGQRFEKIMIAMQKLQELGQPPKELVGDMGPIMSFDPAGNPILPDLTSMLGPAGMVPGGAAGDASEGDVPQGEQCCLM